MNKKALFLAIVICSLTLARAVYAENDSDNTTAGQMQAAADIQKTVGTITNLIRLVGGTVGTLVITVGGILLMTAGESPEKKDHAKQVITMGVIGLIVILVAPSLVSFILG